MKFRLVKDAAQWMRWHSSQAFAVLIALPAAWAATPQLQAAVPPKYAASVAAVIAAIGLIGRLRDQALKPPLPKPTVPPDNDFHQRDP